ncbi:hypothetical protein PACTADRAFT_50144 [Pachysolen tannophilus NRRL Y-2460]|uniref:Gfo/Idh/MocA-like oxidoreductase N-terminal domain-containing protein n=1 Tax=Pachysolen tannophilus NRRL Y-2460 TaxID=669874 RepID=A0A1E4TUT6_PACTA|nr:hypothetical protein PACTADRAFT_50144 [Pachysolen tannophilus NRRL Y-2460]
MASESKTEKPLKLGIIGTGIFAVNNHLPTFEKLPNLYLPWACYNRTKAKAEDFAVKAKISSDKIHDSLESIVSDPDVDVIDALLPVQYNLDVVKLAVKYGKPLAMEKPIAANLDQAREIVKISKENPQLPIIILEQWSYYKAITILKEKLNEIGNVVSFTYKSTGPFYVSNKYLKTSWRAKPEHIGGFLSDGGVHQLALLTGVLGRVSKVSGLTKQVRKQSGADDILYSCMTMENGLIGTFTYGSAFGATKKSCVFEIMGDNGSISFDFTPKRVPTATVLIGANGDVEPKEEVIQIENENSGTLKEFEVFSEALKTKDFTKILSTPEVCFHHLAVIDAALKSSSSGGNAIEVQTP